MCVCVFNWWGGRWGLSVCVLSTLPSAKSLPMPLWFYLLYDFLVNFIFLCAILISLTMPIKGNVFEKKTSVFLLAASLLSPLFACDECHFVEHCCAARWYDYDL